MGFKVYYGDNFRTQKAIHLYQGGRWKDAVRGWVRNEGSWKIAYPEFPESVYNPVISLISGTDGIVGARYSVSSGGWNIDKAFIPNTLTYQWFRGATAISGATASAYTTVAADVDNVLAVEVTGTNNRGSTTLRVTGVVLKPAAPLVTAFNSTTVPSPPSIVIVGSNSGETFYAVWGAGTNATSYDGYTTNGSFNTFDPAARSATGVGVPGYVAVQVRSINTIYSLTASWGVVAGAASYDVYVNGSFVSNTTSTSYIYSPGSTASVSFTVRAKSPLGNLGAAGAAAAAAANTFSNYVFGEGSILYLPPSGGTVSISGTGEENTYIYSSFTAWDHYPVSYSSRLAADTNQFGLYTTTKGLPTSSLSVDPYLITNSDAGGLPYYFRAQTTATNPAGSVTAYSNIILSFLTPPPPVPTGLAFSFSSPYVTGYDGVNGIAEWWCVWDDTPGAANYDVQFRYATSAAGAGSTADPVQTNATKPFYAINFDPLIYGSFRVRSKNASGLVSAFSAWSAWF